MLCTLTKAGNLIMATLLYGIILFNEGHVLQSRSETVAFHRWMNMALDDYDGQTIPKEL